MVRILGTLLFQGLQATILERPIPDRKDVAIYIDEFQDYIASYHAVQNFQLLFREGRRHLTSLTIAHQDFGWIDSNLLQTIHGNVGAAASFSCGPSEAQQMSRVFGFGSKSKRDPLEPPTVLNDATSRTVAFLPDHQAITRVGEEVKWIETYPPPKKFREIIYEEFSYKGQNPPDPLEEFANRDQHQSPRDKMRRHERGSNPSRDITLARALKPRDK